MSKYMKRIIISAECLLLLFCLGCGQGKFDRTTLEFEKSGEFVLHIVDNEFDESAYDYEELKALNEAEVNVYNSYGKGKATVEYSSMENGKLRIDIRYNDDDAYYDINNVVLFYGTASTAKNIGYNLVGKVTSTGGEGVLDQATWNTMSEEKVVVVSEDIAVKMPGKILYAGEGVTLTGPKEADAEGEGLRYIISE